MGPNPTVLMSPLFTIEEDSCLNIVVKCLTCSYVSGLINVTLFHEISINKTTTLVWIYDASITEIRLNISASTIRIGLAAVSKYEYFYLPEPEIKLHNITVESSKCEPVPGNGVACFW